MNPRIEGYTRHGTKIARHQWLEGSRALPRRDDRARSVEQLDENLKAADVKLSDEDVRRLDDASAFELGYPYKFIASVQKRW